MRQTIEEIKDFVRRSFSGSPGSHGWDHTLRVHNLCMHLGEMEGGDREVLEIAAYLHDVGRPFQDAAKGRICHAQKGAEMAETVLKDYPIADHKKRNIIGCIRTHRFRGDATPQTLEARILYDADKLDAIGAVGIGRAFLFAGEVGARLHNPHVNPVETEPYTEEDTGYREFKLKLSKIKDRMLTAEGRRMAEDRHAFMEMYFQRFLEEYEGRK